MLIDEIPRNWRNALSDFIETERGKNILHELDTLLKGDRGNYNPRRKNIFAAFKKTPFKKVRVVIIGQNPYANPNHATGLAFFAGRCSTPSLVNINCAIRLNFPEETGRNNLTGKNLTNNCLKRWAKKEHVLLLNRVLTFRNDGNGNDNRENAHKVDEWEQFTQAVVTALARKRTIHFMRWGGEAQEIELPNNYPVDFIHDTNLPAQQRQDYVQVFLDSRQFLDVNTEIKDNPRKGELPINWFPPE